KRSNQRSDALTSWVASLPAYRSEPPPQEALPESADEAAGEWAQGARMAQEEAEPIRQVLARTPGQHQGFPVAREGVVAAQAVGDSLGGRVDDRIDRKCAEQSLGGGLVVEHRRQAQRNRDH